jgi:hypothetical protein
MENFDPEKSWDLEILEKKTTVLITAETMTGSWSW